MNVVYSESDLESKAAYDAIKQFAKDKSIEIESSVALILEPSDNDYKDTIKQLEKSRSRVIVVLTHTVATAKLLLAIESLRYNDKFEVIMWNVAFYVHSYLLQLTTNDTALVNRVVDGIFVVAAFSGVGTDRFVLVHALMNTLWCNLKEYVHTTAPDMQPWKNNGGTKHPPPPCARTALT